MLRLMGVFLSLASFALAVPPVPTDGTPEPTSMLLMGLGGAGYALYNKFKK